MVPRETSPLPARWMELRRSLAGAQRVPEAQSIAITFPTPVLPTPLFLPSTTPALSSFFLCVTHHSVPPSSPRVAHRALGTTGSQPAASPRSRCQQQLPDPNPASRCRQRQRSSGAGRSRIAYVNRKPSGRERKEKQVKNQRLPKESVSESRTGTKQCPRVQGSHQPASQTAASERVTPTCNGL